MVLVSSSSETIPIKFLLFPSITHQYAFGFIKFPNNSHRIPLVPINNPSKSFVLIKSLLFPSSSHQNPFVPTTSHQLHFVPSTSFCSQLNPTQSYINPHKALNFVRDLGRVLNGAPQFLGRPGRQATLTGRRLSDAAEQKVGDFVPARFCGKPRADLFLARLLPSRTAALLPSCVRVLS